VTDEQWKDVLARARAGDVGALEQLAEAPPSALPEVIALVPGADVIGRMTLADVISQLGRNAASEAVPTLVSLLADSDELVRAHAALALGAFGSATDLLVDRLRQDPAALVRASAAEALGEARDRGAIDALFAALSDADQAVRGYAANAIGMIGEAGDADRLARATQAEAAAEVLAEVHGSRYRLGRREALSALLSLLAGADALLAINLLNVVQDLLERAPPAALATDLPLVEAALAALQKRMPGVTDVRRVLDAMEQFRSSSR